MAKLPSTYLLNVDHDSLRDDAFIYEGRLKRVGVLVIHNHYEHIFHGSLVLLDGPFALDIVREMISDIIKYLEENL